MEERDEEVRISKEGFDTHRYLQIWELMQTLLLLLFMCFYREGGKGEKNLLVLCL